MFSRAPDSAAKSFLYSGVFWLLAGSIALLVSWLKLADADFLSTKLFSYPRIRAAGSLSLVYGWLLLSSLAAIFYIVPRLTGARIRSERAAEASAWLVNVALVLAVTATMLGGVKGHEFLELPRWAAWVLVAALAMNALNVIRTVEARVEERLYVSVWYFIGAVVWAPIAIAAGALPSFAGVRDSIAHLFGVGTLFAAVFPAAGLGAVYYLVPRATGRPLYSNQLAQLGFWWLAFIAPLTGQARQVFGPSQDWLQTLAITASIAMLLPVVTVLVNVFGTLRGGWDRVPDHPSVRFAVGGVVLWAVAVGQGAVVSFRSAARIVGSTVFVTSQVWLLIVAFTLVGAASITYAFPRLVGRRWHRGHRVTVHFWLTMIGGTIIAISGWASGIVTGTIWHTGAVIGKTTGTGGDFGLVLGATERFAGIGLVGAVLFAAAQWLFASNLFRSTTLGAPHPIEVVAPSEDEPERSAIIRVRILVAATLGVFLAALGVGYAAPIADGELAKRTDYSIVYSKGSEAVLGKQIYSTEGCWYCHTQAVRPVPADLGLGTVTTADRVVGDSPSVLGLARVGPDLACAGDRFAGAGMIVEHLRNPRADHPRSVMPRYDFLSERQLESLAAYLMQLRCQPSA